MAITAYGVDQSITEPKWARIHKIVGPDQVVDDALNALEPTVATGTRVIDVASGYAVVCGVLVEVSATETVTLDANSSGNSRIDYIVLEVDWSGSSATGGDVKFVKGTADPNPLPPALTQTEGTLWQMPLAKITVRNGVGQIADADLEDVRPLERKPIVYKEAVTIVDRVHDAAPVEVCRVNVEDPGWPYKLQVYASVKFENAASGFGVITVLLDGSEFVTGRTDVNLGSPAQCSEWTLARRTGTSIVRVDAEPTSMDVGDHLVTQHQHSNITVVVHPS